VSKKLQELSRALAKGNLKNKELVEFKSIFSQLSIAKNGVILKGKQMVKPETLVDQVVKLAHEGHQGPGKTKSLLRSRIWFPKIDAKVNEACENFKICAINAKKSPEPLKVSKFPSHPWEELCVDFHDLPNGQELLVLKDKASKMEVVEEVPSTAGPATISKLDDIFSLLGIPKKLTSDKVHPTVERPRI
jgi:hypothetical protein